VPGPRYGADHQVGESMKQDARALAQQRRQIADILRAWDVEFVDISVLRDVADCLQAQAAELDRLLLWQHGAVFSS
jgi:S-adenosylmethionine:diacylglycerol 3-amino-3-carboxypropyl transferase